MGFCGSLYCNMGDILIIWLLCKLFFLWLVVFFQPRASYHLFLWHDVHTFQLKGVEPPGFSFQIVNTNMDELSPRARRRSALLTWQHIASLPPSLPVVYCGGFNTPKESTTGRFLLGRSRYPFDTWIYSSFVVLSYVILNWILPTCMVHTHILSFGSSFLIIKLWIWST